VRALWRLILTTMAAVLGLWLARRAHRAQASSHAIIWFAGAALANHWLMEAWKLSWLEAVRPLLVGGAAASGLVVWGAIAWLVHLHPKRRDPWFRIPLFLVAVVAAIAGAPWG